MPGRVLLVSINRCANPDPVFPLGLAFVASALRKTGHEVRWFDVLASERSLEECLGEFRPQYVGVSLRNIDDVILRKQEVFFDQLQSLCETVRRVAGCPVILGGSGFSIFPAELLEFSGADYGISGAGESAMIGLLACLEGGQAPSKVPGLVYREGGEVRMNAVGCHTSAPDGTLEWPEQEVAYYLRTTGTLNVQTQRGCAFRCCYCTYPLLEGRVNQRRPPEQVAEDFAQAVRLGAKYLFVVDSVFNSSPRHVQEICEAILRRNLKVPWGCFLRPQHLSAELMRVMARAGLKHIEFGSDSFSDAVLVEYRKGLSFEDIRHSSELAEAEKIEYCHFLISGGPGETAETLQESFARSKELAGAVIMAMPGMRIYPGTPLFERARSEGCIDASKNLLAPCYYLAPGLEAEQVYDTLRGFSRLSSNWIVGDSSPAFTSMVERLRRRGIMGPVWSYASLLQRLWPTGFQGQLEH